jgi:DNA-binding SARP family transcriptional activator
MDGRLEIFPLGGVRILKGGEAVAGLNNQKAEALLIYLASTRRPQPREVLADLFLTAAHNTRPDCAQSTFD